MNPLLSPVLYRFTASGATPEGAVARYTAQEHARPRSPFVRHPDLTRVKRVTVVVERAALRAAAAELGDFYAAFDGPDGGPLCEDDAEWLADRLTEEDDPCIRSGGTGALLLDTRGAERSWLFFGWTVQSD
ncbi:hypothetical protein ACIBEA_42665 [Streptomyces sp. NPDC051555]|uniref:hypothetical protein n=1 Tax=Streptomyces sp. NPDC051555 TaxID=3365657 RepID=UPI0037A57DB2